MKRNNEKENVEMKEGMLYHEIHLWFTSVADSGELKPKTLNVHDCIIKLIMRKIDNQGMTLITTDYLQGIFQSMAKDGFSASTLKKIKTILNRTYKLAIRTSPSLFNPITDVTIPKIAVEKEVLPLTCEEQIGLEKICESDPHGDIFLFLLYTGLRSDELRNLQWSDYLPKYKMIKIRNSKTKAGIRQIPLLPNCEAIIALQPKINEYIFNNRTTGKPITVSVMRRTYERLRRLTGFNNLTNHVCRHSFATRLVENGADPKAISSLLGHTSVAFTLDRYVTAQPEYLRRHIELLSPATNKN